MTTITGLSSMATKGILDGLSKAYEAKSGVTVDIRAMGGVDAAKRVREGEATDVVVLAAGVMAKLEIEGHIAPGSIQGVVRSTMAIVVKAGAPHPDIGDEAAVKTAVMAARTAGYSTGPSGDHFVQLCERWGIAPDKLVKATPGIAVGALVAQGDAEIGFQQLSEFIDVPGIDVLGPLPPEIQLVTIFSAGIAASSSQPQAAQDLIAYFVSPETVQAKQEQGMGPA